MGWPRGRGPERGGQRRGGGLSRVFYGALKSLSYWIWSICIAAVVAAAAMAVAAAAAMAAAAAVAATP